MDVLFLMSISRLYRGLKLSFEHSKCRKKLFFWWQVSVGILDFLHVSKTKNINLVEPLVMVTRTWSSYFVFLKYLVYMQYFMMLRCY